jgi:hypothetical protein
VPLNETIKWNIKGFVKDFFLWKYSYVASLIQRIAILWNSFKGIPFLLFEGKFQPSPTHITILFKSRMRIHVAMRPVARAHEHYSTPYITREQCTNHIYTCKSHSLNTQQHGIGALGPCDRRPWHVHAAR